VTAGSGLTGATQQHFTVINPATQESCGEAPDLTPADAISAVDRAAEAVEWGATTLLERTQIFDRLLPLIERDAAELARLVTIESGKPISESEYEVWYAREIFRVFRDEAPIALSGISSRLDAQFTKTNDYYFSHREPLGVVLAILSFNNPAELFAYKVAPALLAGNRVIVKPSTLAPLTALHLTGLLYEAGVPRGAVQCLTSTRDTFGDALTGHDLIRCVSFTGSTPVGRHVAQRASHHLAKVILELGGNDPLIVLPDADIERAVHMTAAGRAENAGQSCCANKRMIVHEAVADEFTERLIETLRAGYPIGNPIAKATTLGPLITPQAAQRVDDAVRHTVTQGARLAFGGQREGASYYTPAVLTGVDRSMDVANNLEIFGPVFPIIVADSDKEILSIANQTDFGLNSAVFTSSIDHAFWFATRLECGMSVINGNPLYRPFIHGHGGVKSTGTGREGLRHSFQELTNEKGIAFRNVL
jgi:acyl-CoA reductase-like NAD-dependent aldehyde dehydrogenase